MTTYIEAANLLGLQEGFNILQLKDAYRAMILKWHPDKFVTAPDKKRKKAQEVAQAINAAYDLLEKYAVKVDARGESYWKQIADKLPAWKKEFRYQWKLAYSNTLRGEYPGLHLNTCIATFTRGRIEPRPEWFLNCLFVDSSENRAKYWEHLSTIAPNRSLRHSYAERYFSLEFGDCVRVFYLPPAKD